MPIKQRSVLTTQNTTLSTNKDTAFPDNNNKEITALDLRTWLNELLSQVQDILDSYFNKLDELRITSTLSYDIVATPTDWNGGTAPATQNLVNDELASRVKTIEGEPNQTAFETPYTATTSADWGAIVPSEVRGGLDILAQKTLTNASSNIVYVSKQGSDVINEFEVGNSLKPFLTIQAAVDSMPTNNCILKVLGGGVYNESVTIPNNKTNCVFDFGNCTVTNLVAAFSNAETNNNLIQNLFITNPISFTDLRSTFLNNVIVTSTNQFVYCYSKYVLNCSFTGSNNTTVITTSQNTFTKYWNNCIIINIGTGGAVYRSPNTIFNNCKIESGAGFAFRSTPGIGDDITKISKLINCSVKSDNYAITGESLEPNILAYKTKFYSSNFYPLRISNNSKILLFDSCEFYAKAANPCVFLNANILRTATQNYVFKECTFHTVTGFPFVENAYDAGDLGQTLVLNCVANKATMTSVATVKITENNNFFFTNYTDFNNLQ